MSDHVPLCISYISQGAGLAGKFLQAVFAEDSKSGLVGFADAIRGEGLTHRHERDFFGISSGAARGSRNPFLDFGYILCDGHENSKPRRTRRITKENLGNTWRGRSRRTSFDYIIAVGGAGSLGSPALDSGNRIINVARAIITMSPTRYDGLVKICGRAQAGANCNPAQTSPSTASPAINPEAVRTPALSTRAFCASLNTRRRGIQSPTEWKTPPRKMAKFV